MGSLNFRVRLPFIPLNFEPTAGPGAAGALRCAEAVRGERRETTYYASARLDGLLRRVEHVSSPRQLEAEVLYAIRR